MRTIDADRLLEERRIHTYYHLPNGDIAIPLIDIKNAPTIEPERKKGTWEIYVISPFDGEGCKCSECGFEGVPYWNYCPNCGARMMEGEG